MVPESRMQNTLQMAREAYLKLSNVKKNCQLLTNPDYLQSKKTGFGCTLLPIWHTPPCNCTVPEISEGAI